MNEIRRQKKKKTIRKYENEKIKRQKETKI